MRINKVRVQYLLAIKEICDTSIWASPKEIVNKMGKKLDVVCMMLRRLLEDGLLEKGGRGMYRPTKEAIDTLRKLGYLE